MEGYNMNMSQAHGGFPATILSALPPLPPSRFGRNSNQCSTPLLPSGDGSGPNPSSEKLQLLQRHQWINQSDLNLNLHGSIGKGIVTDGVLLHFPTKKDSGENKKVVLHGLEKDPTLEAKRLKRVIQSRQYSQKYRLKQLHYISQLESEVKALQAEVTITSPRINFIDRQNSLLRAENYSIKEKLSAYTGEILFKEAQYEELKQERNMLKEVYEGYQQKLLETLRNNNNGGSNCYQLVNNIQPENNLNQESNIDPLLEIIHKTNPFNLLES